MTDLADLEPAMGKRITLVDMEALMDMMHDHASLDPIIFHISVHRYQQLRRLRKPYERLVRRKKIARRQQRAAQRRRRKGLD